jgi:AcrR family transcriptional regulator
MMSQSIRSKRRYTLMRQEIIQAARQIIKEQGIDGLSMRAIARLVHTSPANLYEYFLNKEEIVFSVYNDILSNLLLTLQLVKNEPPGRTQLLGLCINYIDFIGQDPSQIQILSYPFQLESTNQPQRAEMAAAPVGVHAPNNTSVAQFAANVGLTPSAASYLIRNEYSDPTVTAYKTNLQNIFRLFLQAVEQCIAEGSISATALTTTEIAHTIWAFTHGLVTLRIQDISTIDRQIAHKALTYFLDGLVG